MVVVVVVVVGTVVIRSKMDMNSAPTTHAERRNAMAFNCGSNRSHALTT